MKLTTLLRTPALLLALLEVGLTALWVRSFWRSDIFGCFWVIPDDPIAKRSPYTSKFFNVSTGRGGICLFVSRTRVSSSTNPPRPVIYGHESVPSPMYPFATPRAGTGTTHRIAGFGFTHALNVQSSLLQT